MFCFMSTCHCRQRVSFVLYAKTNQRLIKLYPVQFFRRKPSVFDVICRACFFIETEYLTLPSSLTCWLLGFNPFVQEIFFGTYV